MPWKVQKKGDKHCVVVSSGPKEGQEVACHDTRPKAVAQVKALYANDAASLYDSAFIVPCIEEACERTFILPESMFTHDEAVHAEPVDDSFVRIADYTLSLLDNARKFGTKERKTAAKKGQAMSHGGFPIKNEQDLRNAIKAFGRAKNKAGTKAHIIKRAKALGLTKLLPKGWKVSTDKAHEGLYGCPEEGCERSFRDEAGLFEHAEAVHTFDDIRRLVSEAVREKYGRAGQYNASPPIPAIWVWVDDLADDWVVYMVEEGVDSTLYKASYSITDNEVTLGEPTEVRRRTVYEPVKKSDGD